MNTLQRALKGLALPLFASTALAGCVVGPDYKGPPQAAPLAQSAPAFHRQASAGVVQGPAAARWWTSLNDPELDRLVEAALVHSPDVRAAQARLRQSRAMLGGAKANLLPSVGANAGVIAANGIEIPGRGSNVALFNAGFDATWEVDLFGGKQRAVEQASASAEAVQADLEDLKVSLAAETAQAYVQLRDQQQRAAIAAASADLEARLVGLAEDRKGHGVGSDLDLERLRGQLEATRASLIPIRGSITESLDRLAVLTGREPGTLDAELSTSAPLPELPAVVQVSDPAEMMRRRPDIRAAERRLASQNAVIGERTADLFPKLNLLGFIGWGATDLTRLFDTTTSVAAPMLQWNALDFGRTRARIGEAEAGRDVASAQYEKTVLNALNDAETALSRLGQARQSVIALAKVEASAAKAAELTRQRHQAGVASVIDVLDTERTRLDAEQNLAAAKAQLVQAYVALQKSLGLGWEQAA